MSVDKQQKAATLAMLHYVKAGIKIGLGASSTANHFTRTLAAKLKDGLDVQYVESGLGREGSHHGVEEYLEMKYLLMGGLGK